jgi:hypothetical protein
MKVLNFFERGNIMGIGILIVVIGSLIYKGRDRIQKIFNRYRYRPNEKRPRS